MKILRSLADVAQFVREASAFGLIDEEERVAQWGGRYSIYSVTGGDDALSTGARAQFAKAAAEIGAVELELAATAAYLASVEGCSDPWDETARRKPDKARDGHLEKAKDAYQQLSTMQTPQPLPKVA